MTTKDGGIEQYQRDELRRIREWNAFVLAERKRMSGVGKK